MAKADEKKTVEVEFTPEQKRFQAKIGSGFFLFVKYTKCRI